MLLTLASIYGLCLLFGSLNLFFKDIGNLVAIVMQVAFFGTPIMYVLSVVPQEYYWCFKVNPVGATSHSAGVTCLWNMLYT